MGLFHNTNALANSALPRRQCKSCGHLRLSPVPPGVRPLCLMVTCAARVSACSRWAWTLGHVVSKDAACSLSADVLSRGMPARVSERWWGHERVHHGAARSYATHGNSGAVAASGHILPQHKGLRRLRVSAYQFCCMHQAVTCTSALSFLADSTHRHLRRVPPHAATICCVPQPGSYQPRHTVCMHERGP